MVIMYVRVVTKDHSLNFFCMQKIQFIPPLSEQALPAFIKNKYFHGGLESISKELDLLMHLSQFHMPPVCPSHLLHFHI